MAGENKNSGENTITYGKTLQSNILKNTKDYKDFGYFLTGVDVTDQNLDAFTPYLKGRGRLWFYKTPPFMYNGFNDITTRFQQYLEAGYTKVDGIQDMQADFVEFEGGFAGQKFSNISSVKDDMDTLSVDLYEQSGSPVREFIETWLTGVKDPRTNISHYHGVNMAFCERNHTGEFIYYVLDPTGKQIEYACMFAHAIPTKVPKDHLNYEKGDNGEVLLNLEFRCEKYESVYINQLAIWHLQKSNLQFNYLDFNPNYSTNSHAAYTPGAKAFGRDSSVAVLGAPSNGLVSVSKENGTEVIRSNVDSLSGQVGAKAGEYSPAIKPGTMTATGMLKTDSPKTDSSES